MKTRTRSEPPEGSLDEGASFGESGERTSVDPDRSGQRIGHFILREKLGQGGMGVVYAADDEKLRRRVALKLLPAEVAGSPERRRRFLREARSASAFVHPNVAAIFEIGEDGDDLFLVMELALGRSLRVVIRERCGPLGVAEALFIARAVARGVARAHQAGVVHRDLKPENVVIAEGGAVKVLDFGVARLLRPQGVPLQQAPTESEFATVEGRILGTPGYMAPEQAHGRAVDARADVFSFGVMLHEMLAGERPFGGDTALARLFAVDRDPPSPLPVAVPPALTQVVARCLEKQPESRFASCAEVAEALDALQAAQAPLFPRTPEALHRGRVERVALVVLVALVALSAAAALAVALAPFASRAPLAQADAASAAASSPRRLCVDADAGRIECSQDGAVAWCDPGGRRIACCGRGLVPVGVDGICGCPPGGTEVPQAIARGCKPPPPGRKEEIARVHQGATQRVLDCFLPLFDAGKIDGGGFSATYALSPEGEVLDAQIQMSSMPNEDAQACALAVLRATRFPPPPGEDAGELRAGFGFEFKSRAEQEQR